MQFATASTTTMSFPQPNQPPSSLSSMSSSLQDAMMNTMRRNSSSISNDPLTSSAAAAVAALMAKSSSPSITSSAHAHALSPDSIGSSFNGGPRRVSTSTCSSVVSMASSSLSSMSKRGSLSSVVSGIVGGSNATSSNSGGNQNGGSGELIPIDFVPTPYTVVCGRGKRCSENVGNRRLQVIASMFIGRYSLASRKEDKSLIVSEILQMVKEACPFNGTSTAFVRYDSSLGRWMAADNLCAREKIGTVLRDCLHSKYKSSTKSKLQRRKARKEVAKKEQLMKNLDRVRNPTIQFRLLPLPLPPPSESEPTTTKGLSLRRELSSSSLTSSTTTTSV